MPTARPRSPVSVRMAAVRVRAATRAISPSRRRRYRQSGADLVEYNPLRDVTGLTGMVAAKVLKELLDAMAR
jgi:arginase family enzyme